MMTRQRVRKPIRPPDKILKIFRLVVHPRPSRQPGQSVKNPCGPINRETAVLHHDKRIAPAVDFNSPGEDVRGCNKSSE
jgi:hypothetical protein